MPVALFSLSLVVDLVLIQVDVDNRMNTFIRITELLCNTIFVIFQTHLLLQTYDVEENFIRLLSILIGERRQM